MFTNQECRQILGSSANLTDAELDLLRIGMYELAEAMVDVFIHERRTKSLVESENSNQDENTKPKESWVQNSLTKH